MDTFDELNNSLEQTMRRTFAIGRFKVSVEEILQPKPPCGPPSAKPSVSSILENPGGGAEPGGNNVFDRMERNVKRRISQSKMGNIYFIIYCKLLMREWFVSD